VVDQTKRNTITEITDKPKSSRDYFLENFRYVQDNWRELQETYGGMRLAVLNNRVIAVSDNPREFLSALSGLADNEKACTYITRINYLNELVVV
jgi:hypothetical protein